MNITPEFIREIEDISDKFNSVLTALYYDCDFLTVENSINSELKKVNTIKDTYKRKFYNDRIYLFLEYIRKNYNSDNSINSLFLVANNEINEIKLTKKQISYCREYGVRKDNILRGKGYNIEFLTDIFISKKVYNIIKFDNKDFTHSQISLYKNKFIVKKNIDKFNEYIKNISDKILFHGISSFLKSLSYELLFNKNLSKEELLDEFYKSDTKEVHKRLEEFLNNILNPKYVDKIKYGKDIVKGINYMTIKTLFYCSEKKDKLFTTFSKDLLNFELVEIKPLISGDIYDTLKSDYSGFIAESYY